MSDNHNVFHHLRSCADILTVITLRISATQYNKFITRTFIMDICKAFDKTWHLELLPKLSSYGLFGSALYNQVLSKRNIFNSL